MSIKLYHKWGFGMAPLSANTKKKNEEAVKTVHDFLIDPSFVFQGNIQESISTIKGMVNRIRKQDQWDWFTVYAKFGYPKYSALQNIIQGIERWKNEEGTLEEKKLLLINSGLLHLLKFYLGKIDYNELYKGVEYVYILSIRESRDILKIGQSKREVELRLKEINGKTGVVIPFGIRALFKVKKAVKAEKIVHDALSDYRIRNDREFFNLDFRDASQKIRDVLKEENQSYRLSGAIESYVANKRYGFIKCGNERIYFSAKNSQKENYIVNESVEFELSTSIKGLYAYNIN